MATSAAGTLPVAKAPIAGKRALIGALSLSVVAAFVSANFGPTWSPVTFYLALFVILLVRPQGLLGKKPEL